MFSPLLAFWSTFFLYTTMSLFVFVCLILILLILIQKGRGGGLVSAFSGGGGNSAFGAKTGDVLTWATSIIFGVFLVLAIILNLLTQPSTAPSTTSGGPTPPTQSTPAGNPK